MSKHLLLVAATVSLASGCGLFDSDDHAQSPDAGPDVGVESDAANMGNADNSDAGSTNNGGLDMEVEPPDTYYSSPREDRCADTSFERCGNVTLEEIAPAPASRLSYMMLADVDVDCEKDWPEDITAAYDGLGCSFVQLAQLIEGPLEPRHIQIPFVYELYGAETKRIGIYEVDENETVVDAPYRYLTRSLWGFDDVTVDGGVTGTDGTAPLYTDYWGFPLKLTIRGASLTSTSTTNDEGVEILGVGELRGHIEIVDLYDSLNAHASVCAGEPVTPFTAKVGGEPTCAADYSAHELEACRSFDTYCPLFEPLGVFADVDLNDDGLNDAFSVRFDVEFVEGTRAF